VLIHGAQGLSFVKGRKSIPTSRKKRDLLEFAFGSEPIVELMAWTGAALEIDLVCASADLILSWYVAHRCFFCLKDGPCLTAIPILLWRHS
jgi:hypothetical protein